MTTRAGTNNRATFLLPLAMIVSVAGYLLATIAFDHPKHWDDVRPGLTRAQANELLDVYPWQADNSAYLVFDKRGLRSWYIDVSFGDDTVSAVSIFHEDLHEEIVTEIRRVFLYWTSL